jgi:hypothetical protein
MSGDRTFSAVSSQGRKPAASLTKAAGLGDKTNEAFRSDANTSAAAFRPHPLQRGQVEAAFFAGGGDVFVVGRQSCRQL